MQRELPQTRRQPAKQQRVSRSDPQCSRRSQVTDQRYGALLPGHHFSIVARVRKLPPPPPSRCNRHVPDRRNGRPFSPQACSVSETRSDGLHSRTRAAPESVPTFVMACTRHISSQESMLYIICKCILSFCADMSFAIMGSVHCRRKRGRRIARGFLHACPDRPLSSRAGFVQYGTNSGRRELSCESREYSVEISDLYREEFDPCERSASLHESREWLRFLSLWVSSEMRFKTDTLPDDVQREIARLERTDLVVLQFPDLVAWSRRPF